MNRKLSLPLVLIFLALIHAAPAELVAQDLFTIPNPRKDFRWVVDTTDQINRDEMDRVNRFCEELHQKTKAEIAVVIIETTGRKSIEAYALELFNHWGIGNSFSDNGILFLIAKKDRKMRIALGDGIDVRQQERMAQRILDEEVTPRFRLGKWGEGIYAGTRGTATRILGLKDADFDGKFAPPPDLPVSAMRNVGDGGANKNRNFRGGGRNRGGTSAVPFVLIGGLVGLGGISVIGGRYWLRYRARYCEICSEELIRLEDPDEDQFLENPELLEERLGSVDYDVWACISCEEVMKVRYGKFFTRYSTCPSCGYRTKYRIKRTVIRATTSRGGRVHVEEDCAHCSYHNEYYYSTPRKSKSSSGSSFGSGGGSRGGSFGGGRSSGGGASGSW